ncbi:MAG: ABC transporter ATP-binding protein [Acidimicrobiia bacterium]|nr:MAG: ABC transporter ATP-binding protein [Acidimicrobiia bacterium]
MMNGTDPLLELHDLEVKFFTRRGVVSAVRGVSMRIAEGETLGLVGESGSGKSVTARSILGLIDLPGRITNGDITWRGESLLDEAVIARVRGNEIAVVFQDAMTSLHPILTIGTQITEVLRRHLGMGRREATDRAAELVDLVGIPSPRQRLSQYPFELSGGMRQRVLIAIALACEPKLLIADEPTTALDVTIQAQILELIAALQQEFGLAMLLITHDLGVVAEVCDRVAVMYAGRIVERASTEELFDDPGHPYAAGLLAATPGLEEVTDRLVTIDGQPPDARHRLPGCSFAPRCVLASERCATNVPELEVFEGGREVACWYAFDVPEFVGRTGSHGP